MFLLLFSASDSFSTMVLYKSIYLLLTYLLLPSVFMSLSFVWPKRYVACNWSCGVVDVVMWPQGGSDETIWLLWTCGVSVRCSHIHLTTCTPGGVAARLAFCFITWTVTHITSSLLYLAFCFITWTLTHITSSLLYLFVGKCT